MNYTEILARQEELTVEMEQLQKDRIACSQNHDDLTVTSELTSGKRIQIDLDYGTSDKEIFTIATQVGDEVLNITFTVEDYNEISQFFSKYNDAIFSYMSEITKDDADEAVEA